MASSGKEQGMFRVVAPAPPQERTGTPVRPERETRPTPTPAPEPGKLPKTKKSLLQRLVRNLALRYTLLAGLSIASAGYGAYKEVPAVHQQVDNVLGGFGLTEAEIAVSPIFDAKADTQLIQAGINATPISEEELPFLLKDPIKPLEKNKFPDITILLPVKLTGGQKIEVHTNYVDQAWNPITQKPGLTYGKIITIPNKGTEIIVPVENAEVFIGTTNVGGKDYVSSFTTRFKGPDGTIYGLLLYSPEDIRGLQPTDIMKKAIADGKKKITLPIGTSIAVTNFDNLEVTASLYTHPVDYPKDDYSRDLRSNYTFATRGEDGNQSIVFLPQ